MPLEHILRAMRAQADTEIEKIDRAADQQIAELIAGAETCAHTIRARHRARVEPLLATEVAGLQNKARLGALRAIANAREDLMTDAFAQAQECLSQIRESNRYAAIFRALAQEAVQAIGDHDIIVRVDPRDEEIARKIFSAFNVHAEIEIQAIPLGGLEVTTGDGRIVIVNTLAARLERARKILRRSVARILTEAPTDEKWTMATSMPTPA